MVGNCLPGNNSRVYLSAVHTSKGRIDQLAMVWQYLRYLYSIRFVISSNIGLTRSLAVKIYRWFPVANLEKHH